MNDIQLEKIAAAADQTDLGKTIKAIANDGSPIAMKRISLLLAKNTGCDAVRAIIYPR